MKTSVEEHQARAAGEAAAQSAASQAILAAVQAQAGLQDLVKQLAGQVDKLQKRLTDSASAAEPIEAAVREKYLEQSSVASRPLLTEAQTRRIIDRMLVAAGWVVQDRAATNLHAAQGVAVREVPTEVWRPASPTRWTRSSGRSGCSRSTNRPRSPAGCGPAVSW